MHLTSWLMRRALLLGTVVGAAGGLYAWSVPATVPQAAPIVHIRSDEPGAPSTTTTEPASTATQTVSLSILPGGPVHIDPADAEVSLSAVGGSTTVYRGVVHATVVDPRGTLVGWRVSATATAPPGVHVEVAHASARRGEGGGTTPIELRVQVEAPKSHGTPPPVTVHLTVT